MRLHAHTRTHLSSVTSLHFTSDEWPPASWWCECERFPWHGVGGKMVNYWMQKCDPALMDVEWDNQEANDDRNICVCVRERESSSEVLCTWPRTSKKHPLPPPKLYQLLSYALTSNVVLLQGAWKHPDTKGLFSTHSCARGFSWTGCPRLAAYWHTHAQTHTNTVSRELDKRDGALRVHRACRAKRYWVINHRLSTRTKWKRPLSALLVTLCVVRPAVWPRFPKLGVEG